MKVYKYSALILGVALVLGATVFKDNIQTAVFDDGDFVRCYKSSVMSDIQTEIISNGSGTLSPAGMEKVLGSTLESGGYSIAGRVKKIGVDGVLKRAKADGATETRARYQVYLKEGTFPENTIEKMNADATILCLELQTLF